jgi:hypothetical protein
LAVLLPLVIVSTASAAIVQYDDRTSWEAAVGGPGDATEDFSSFTVDTDFRAAPVALTLGTIQQEGFDAAFRNFIDVPPLTYTDNNGTNHASSFVNSAEAGPGTPPPTGAGNEDTPPDSAPEQGTPATTIRVAFPGPVTAWGGDVYGALGLELLAVDVLGAGDTVLATLIPAANNTFIGFVADGGEQVTSVMFRSQTLVPGSGGEGFGLDDMAIASGGGQVPASSNVGLAVLVLLLAVGSAAFLLRRRHAQA